MRRIVLLYVLGTLGSVANGGAVADYLFGGVLNPILGSENDCGKHASWLNQDSSCSAKDYAAEMSKAGAVDTYLTSPSGPNAEYMRAGGPHKRDVVPTQNSKYHASNKQVIRRRRSRL
ncbi:hypothetical protein BKA57DRAFT_190264 [Linnemannia elongata]|nr:hypothetical protein BKA57DRAFT_190264 [Linnemannia elongata]